MILLVKTPQRALITGILGPEGISLPEYLFGPCGEAWRLFRCTRSVHTEQIDDDKLNQERHGTSDQLVDGYLKNFRSLQPLDIPLHRPIRIDILNYSTKACGRGTP
jgi:GDP-D-mannose dehydratase